MTLRILPLLLLFACGTTSTKKETIENEQSNSMRLHDIWALVAVDGEKIPSDLMKIPVLEIYVEEKRASGNDGCNSIAGPIKKLTDSEIQFGHMMGTKMLCPKMEVTKKFNANLSRVQFFKIEKMALILMDADKVELLQLKKVD